MPGTLRLKNVDIVLENETKVFNFGENVHGLLRIDFKGELPLTNLQIGVVCMSKIKHADETFDQKKLLENFYQLPKAVASQVLRTGVHEIPFRFALPDSSESPPTFDGRYGAINYFVECLIEVEELHRTGLEIKIESPVKSNLLLTVSGSSEKDLGLFCIGSGSVTIEATIDRKGYLPGETIQLKTFINNMTTLKVQPRATLYQTQIFMTGDRHRTLELVLGEPSYGNEVEPNEVAEEVIEITIPSRAQLTMKSNIITVKYFVHVTLDIPQNKDLHINLQFVVTNKAAILEAQQAFAEALEGLEERFRAREERRTKKRLGSASGSKNSSFGSNKDVAGSVEGSGKEDGDSYS